VAVETFDFNENRPRISEPKCIQKAEKIVYRHPDATRFLPNSGKQSCSTATCVGNPRTSKLNMKTTLLQMTEQERATVAAWAIKTAFMIASTQPDISGLPWDLFRGLARTPEQIPDECPVGAGQQDFLDGFMHSSRTDLSSSNAEAIQARVGFSIRKLHFVVVIPFTAGQRMVRTSGVHLPIWPLESEILVRYAFFPTFSSPNDLINYLVDQVECGLFPDKK
jgi:hypothetical protein